MPESDGLNIRIDAGQERRRPCNFKPLNLQQVYKWIDSLDLDPAETAAVKKAAGNYPSQALGSFKRNFNRILAKAQKQLNSQVKADKAKQEDEIVEEL